MGKQPPDEWLHPKVHEYHCKFGHNDVKMAEAIKLDIAKNPAFEGKGYSTSKSSIFRLRGKLGLLGTRQQKKTPGAYDNVVVLIRNLRPAYPTAGARSLVVKLRWEHGIKIPEADLLALLREIEPAEVARQYGARFKRSRFYSAGVMEIWSFDQHDKWKYYGLFLHLCVDPYTGRLVWNQIWWTNRNTALVTGYYLKAARQQKAVPLLTFSDTGRENNGIAKCHSTIRQRLDVSLQGTIQHKWFYDKMNIKSEISWARFRRGFAVGFEQLLNDGEVRGLIDYGRKDALDTFVPLNPPALATHSLSDRIPFPNASIRRSYKHKILPHGIPDEIHNNPEKWGGQNFSVPVPNALLDEMEALWSPPDSPVFELTSPSFNARVQQLYTELGRPVISYDTIWNIFAQLQDRLEQDMQQEEREQVATEFVNLEANFEQDLHLVQDAEVNRDPEEPDNPFFDDRLFTDDENDELDANDKEYEVVLSEDEEEDEVEGLLTQVE
ncbi:hypothetical protein GGX14DRAFT_634170 [Mycena pura]|uniref:Integrase catalytic domain-containing protein n=1 Tax=Mycena pura TaxID=153505 RepID=A0AAD6VCY1_9AGAR|nr:hypothetical protein GGX14DRAFT_634170 [Mycena pura]